MREFPTFLNLRLASADNFFSAKKVGKQAYPQFYEHPQIIDPIEHKPIIFGKVFAIIKII
jgi:hypothetical protein